VVVSIAKDTIAKSFPRWQFRYDCPGGHHRPKPPLKRIEVRQCFFPSR
jgi:hypothetical protein